VSHLRVHAVVKRLGGRRVLDGVSLDVPGGAAALVGPNGVGKSTLLRVAAGLLDADEGSVTLDGELLSHARTRRRLGYVPEAADPPPQLTVREVVTLAASLKDSAPPGDDVVERLGVTSFIDQRVGALSLGQRRRACLLAALAGAPPLMILDEPTNGLDPGGVDMLAALLVERAAAGVVLLATHDLHFAARVGARVVSLRDGRIDI
jgi:ABC-2 type transport system ATP-binding protein